MKFGCLGEVMLELIAGDGEAAQLGVAGDTYNTAVYLAQILGPGSVDYITVLGQDQFSARIMAHMARYDVGQARVQRHASRNPGLYAIETDARGERSFTYWRSQSAAKTLGDQGFDGLFDGLTHLVYSGISLAILPQANRDRLFAALAEFQDQGGIVAFDSNYRPHLWENQAIAQAQIARAWQSCDIALPSLDDEMAIFGEAESADVVRRFHGYGLKAGALKRGHAGPLAFDARTPPLTVALVEVADSTAAGDSFNAGFLAAWARGKGQEAAMRAGHDLACQVVQARGAIIF